MPPPSSISVWEESGQVTPESILRRLDDQIVLHSFDEKERAAIQEKSSSLSVEVNGTKQWDEETFRTFLSQSLSSSSLPLLPEVGPILYSSAAYMSSFPFNTQPTGVVPPSITYEGLLRAVFWLLPGRASLDRTRTASDQRRVLFQSLADTKGDFVFDEDEEKKLAAQRAFKVDDHGRNWALVNYDDEGDEMYHDILDVVSNSGIQLVEKPYGNYDRNDFRSLAKRLSSPTHLRQLAISKSRFKALMKLLLAEHLNDGLQTLTLNLAELETAADHICNTFCQTLGPDEVVTWQKFEWMLSERIPLLFSSLYRLFESLVRTSEDDSASNYVAYPPESLPEDHILSLVTITQLLFTLDLTVAFDEPHLVYQYNAHQAPPSIATVSEVQNAIKFSPKESWDFRLLLVSGKSTSNGERVIFGAFLQELGEDEEIVLRQQDYLERSLLFQLAPIHDVFRSNVGKKAWTADKNNELWLGEKGQGFAIGFDDGLKRLTVVHNVDASDGGVYQTTAWRGDWEMEVDIEKVEVWE